MPPLLQGAITVEGDRVAVNAARRERVIDFAYGNAVFENPRITRDMIRRAYDRLHGADGAGR